MLPLTAALVIIIQITGTLYLALPIMNRIAKKYIDKASKETDEDLRVATERGLKVYFNIDDIPDAKQQH